MGGNIFEIIIVLALSYGIYHFFIKGKVGGGTPKAESWLSKNGAA